MMLWILLLILSSASAIFYRLGGASHSDFPYLPKWLVKGCTRVIGVCLIFILYTLLKGAWHWTVIPSTGLLAIAVNAYHKRLNPFFKKPTTDGYWFNWLAHGFFISLSLLPYVWHFGLWLPFIIRTIMLSLIIMFWSLIFDDVDIEEAGRGGFIILSLPIIL